MRRIVSTAVCFAALTTTTSAQNFRVETDIYVSDNTKPVVQTVTLFADGSVYDFLVADGDGQEMTELEMTLFDPKRGRLILLDNQRRIKTTLTSESMLGFVAQMKTYLLEKKKDHLANPRFEEQFDPQTGWLTLDSDKLTYRVKGQKAKDDQAAKRYTEFADWYARLNAMRVGNVPPFARLHVNSELAERNWLPAEVERTVRTRQGLKKVEKVVRSQHLFTWKLAESDRRRIDQVHSAMASYKSVRFSEFVGLQEVAKNK